MERFVLGIDVGTTSVKTVLVSGEGVLVDEASASHDLISLHTGWAEEDADKWWRNVRKTLRELSSRHPEAVSGAACIGVTGMVPAIVMLDENGAPVRNTIQQNDARSVEEIDFLKERIDQEDLYEKTGGFTNQQHVLPRMLWVRDHEPEAFARMAHVLGSYDYIAYKLTSALSIEMNWAAESGLFDIRKKEWLTDQMEAFGFRPEWFPKVNASMAVIGHVTEQAAAETGLRAGIPVIAGSADHVASTLSAGIINEGDLLIKFGGAGDILYCTEEIATSPKLFFDYHIVPDRYLVNGCMAASGSLVKWYLGDILRNYGGQTLRDLDEEASKLPPGSDGLVILPYFLGEKTPIFDPLARGMIFGLTLSHTRAHIFRACLEAVIYGFRHHIDTIREMGFRPAHIIATNGGSKSRFWCQIAADVLGETVTAYSSHPGSSLGVAFLAGMAAGVFTNWEQIHLFLKDPKVYEPDGAAHAIYDKSYQIYRALYPATKASSEALAKLYQ
jgi:xylulokinase